MQVLHQLPHVKDKDLLVGIETADDAGVYKISEDVAVITTLDFFPPIVDDPYFFGQIAAANALSDVYAMGGSPRLAMNIVGFPKALGLDVLNDILRGSMEKLNEAGALLVGGHSIEDSEIKYGLSVTGFVHPKKVTTNRGARAGDALILTKPIGVGVITSALKAGRLKSRDAGDALASMSALNKNASSVMGDSGVTACTDITGYGLLGHAMEMAVGSKVNFVIRSKDVRVFPEALKLVKRKSNRPRNLARNIEYLAPNVRSADIDEPLRLLLYDPQTSGGLLMAVPAGKATRVVERLHDRGVFGFVIGEVVEEEAGWRIRVE